MSSRPPGHGGLSALARRGRGRAPSGAPVKSAKRRTQSSSRWLQRQLSDPYVAQARAEGLRSRAAYKLMQIDDRYGILKRGGVVVDLGAAPGGWTQVAVARVGAGGRVLAVDCDAFTAVPGAESLLLDFLGPDAEAAIRERLGGFADVVLSDMAGDATGNPGVDHLRIMALCEAAAGFAETVLAPDGSLVVKVLRGGGEAALVAHLKRCFRSVRHVKPAASRAESSELYLVATGFRGEAGG